MRSGVIQVVAVFRVTCRRFARTGIRCPKVQSWRLITVPVHPARREVQPELEAAVEPIDKVRSHFVRADVGIRVVQAAARIHIKAFDTDKAHFAPESVSVAHSEQATMFLFGMIYRFGSVCRDRQLFEYCRSHRHVDLCDIDLVDGVRHVSLDDRGGCIFSDLGFSDANVVKVVICTPDSEVNAGVQPSSLVSMFSVQFDLDHSIGLVQGRITIESDPCLTFLLFYMLDWAAIDLANIARFAATSGSDDVFLYRDSGAKAVRAGRDDLRRNFDLVRKLIKEVLLFAHVL